MQNPCISCNDVWCCRLDVKVTTEEQNLISTYLSIPKNKLFINNEIIKILSKHGQKVCIFLREDTNQCEIYQLRPRICRKFQCEKLNSFYLQGI